MTMSTEIAHSVAGTLSPRPSGSAGSVRQVQGKPSVTELSAAQAADSGKDVGSPTAVDAQNLQGMVEDLNEMAQTIQRQLAFSVDEDSGKTVIKVIDTETEEVIRQIPPEDIMEMQKKMGEMNGLLFHTSA